MTKHRRIQIGDIYGALQVLENLGYRKYCGYNTTYFKCKCLKCGNVIEVPVCNLCKAQKDCGCWRGESRKPIPVGMIFGRLEVIKRDKGYTGKGVGYVCKCSCGNACVVSAWDLKSGSTKSCGCIHDELFLENSKKGRRENFVENTSVSKIMYADKPAKNNSSGVTGVTWRKNSQKWYARICFKGKSYSLGYYKELGDAIAARKQAEKELFGGFLEWYKENYADRYAKLEARKKDATEKNKEPRN